jgi:recombinational DNA repair protein RecR
MLSPAVDNLVAQLTRLPGIGSRTAQRLAFHIMQTPAQEAEMLQEMVKAAVDAGLRAAQDLASSKMGGITGGLGGLPGM